MRVLITLQISENKKIVISTFNEENVNFLFDEIVIKYHDGDKYIILYNDFLCEGIKSIINILRKVLTDTLEIEPELKKRGIGYEWNIQCNNLYNDLLEYTDRITQYNVWSGSGEQCYDTWLFNDNGKMFLEISPAFNDEKSKPHDFKQFISCYKEYVTIEISKEILTNWLKDCETISSYMEK